MRGTFHGGLILSVDNVSNGTLIALGKQVTMSGQGPRVEKISEEQFREFARRYATSPEIGPIQTSLDKGSKEDDDFERVLVGLWGCDNLCAVACFHLYRSSMDESRHVLKLDSVIVNPALRRRGLGGVLVAHSFIDLVIEGFQKISRIYAHSVHPATVRMLRRLGFKDPQVVGAPISDIGIDPESRDPFIKACEEQIKSHMTQMKLQCQYCLNHDKRARPWCLPRGEKATFK